MEFQFALDILVDRPVAGEISELVAKPPEQGLTPPARWP
jgi:hypothetical protein